MAVEPCRFPRRSGRQRSSALPAALASERGACARPPAARQTREAGGAGPPRRRLSRSLPSAASFAALKQPLPRSLSLVQTPLNISWPASHLQQATRLKYCAARDLAVILLPRPKALGT